MPSSYSVAPCLGFQHRLFTFVGLFSLTFLLLFTLGCGEKPKSQSVVNEEDPEGDFDWVMKRLARRLRPISGGGLNMTDRKITHKLSPPDEKNPHYTATVTVLTKISFLHSKRQTKKAEEKELAEKKTQAELFDPLANDPRTRKEGSERHGLVDIPGTGSRVTGASAASTSMQNLEEESIFHLEYIQGHWQLTEQPEKESQQEWFEYALQ